MFTILFKESYLLLLRLRAHPVVFTNGIGVKICDACTETSAVAMAEIAPSTAGVYVPVIVYVPPFVCEVPFQVMVPPAKLNPSVLATLVSPPVTVQVTSPLFFKEPFI
jgi:hypothetical protein